MANKRNFIIFDTETTGLNPEQGHEIVQIAAKAINYYDFSDHQAGNFEVILKPDQPELASEGALRVIGPLWERAKTEGINQKVGISKFFKWIEEVNTGQSMGKPIFVAHNLPFDWGMLKHWALHHKVVTSFDRKVIPFHYNGICTVQEVMCMFESDPTMMAHNLDTVLDRLGISGRTDVTHDAMEDVERLTEAFRRIMLFRRRCFKRMKVVSSEDAQKLPVR